jgi:hypothetical protein
VHRPAVTAHLPTCASPNSVLDSSPAPSDDDAPPPPPPPLMSTLSPPLSPPPLPLPTSPPHSSAISRANRSNRLTLRGPGMTSPTHLIAAAPSPPTRLYCSRSRSSSETDHTRLVSSAPRRSDTSYIRTQNYFENQEITPNFDLSFSERHVGSRLKGQAQVLQPGGFKLWVN